MKSPEVFKAFGKEVGDGLLFYGPPGCRKTFLARVVAGEVNAHFLHLDLQSILSKWSGGAEQNMNQQKWNGFKLLKAMLDLLMQTKIIKMF